MVVDVAHIDVFGHEALLGSEEWGDCEVGVGLADVADQWTVFLGED